MASARKARTAHDPDCIDNSFSTGSSAGTATLPLPAANHEDLAYYVRHHLNQTERLVVMLHYAEELAFDEIADVLHIARGEVEQIHKLVVGRLQMSLAHSKR